MGWRSYAREMPTGVMSLVVYISNFQCLTKDMWMKKKIAEESHTSGCYIFSFGSSYFTLPPAYVHNYTFINSQPGGGSQVKYCHPQGTQASLRFPPSLFVYVCGLLNANRWVCCNNWQPRNLASWLPHILPAFGIRIVRHILRDTWAALGLNEVHTPSCTSKPAAISPVQSTN